MMVVVLPCNKRSDGGIVFCDKRKDGSDVSSNKLHCFHQEE